ncbi:hypothetical protein G4Y73_06355 [Wenzhouxiangella sp. XN201]|uniref:hypothetical protein n=1 Tax=Wenzhouxiangella sp. XN201 TaxID=2710755 RepID=UPI0013C7B38B|nr:hypothetical protein [Wenzhouxiangella sp. XN201]NEZ03770.1 hypothetical protein [Wenzhouxiangella sp. XN201]
MSDNTVSDIPDRTDPRRTITSRAAALSIWADTQRQRAPELEWQRFDELIEELKAAVPGTGPVKDETAYWRAHSILEMMVTAFTHGEVDRSPDAYVLEAAIAELDKGIEF